MNHPKHTENSDRENREEIALRTGGVDFIRAIVAEDLEAGKYDEVVTRFPPEPNGFLHIGHAKSIVLNFGIAEEFGGRCHLRFDDTNPETEDQRYVDSIIDAVKWLGYDWGEHLYFASDYFEKMYEYAEHLIREGKAYVDSSGEEEIREGRGTVTRPGTPSRYRDRSVEENLDLFRRMRAGEFPNGAHVLRAKIDMASPNMLMRDPILYRIRHAEHYRTGNEWCIYPLYDFAHPLEDAIEGITHSICTLEFENNREFYDWLVESTPVPSRPHQYEFARLNLDYTVMSKRRLLELVREKLVDGWDDPRMPTIAGLRRRGVTPEAVRTFCEMIGVAKADSRVDIGKLEYAIRDDLNRRVPRVLGVLRPLKVVLTNWPEDRVEELDASYFPRDVPRTGSRPLPFSGTLYIDRDDFMEDPPKGYHRLAPGREVRLRHGYIIRCDEVVKNDAGEIVELRCSYDPDSRSGTGGRSVRGTIHWVSAEHAVRCTVRLYDRLFVVPDPDEGPEDFKAYLNPESLVVIEDALVEPSVLNDPPGTRYQFERVGFFYTDPVDSTADGLVFNRTVTLRDTWGKKAQAEAEAKAKRVGAEGPVEGAAGAEPAKKKSRKAKGERGAAGAGPARERPARIERSPELQAKETRFTQELGLSAEEAKILTRDLATATLFEAALAEKVSPKGVANWIINELPREIGDRALDTLPFGGPELGRLVELVENDTISSSAGREVLAEMADSGADPAAIVESRGLRQISDPAILEPIVDQIVAANMAKATEYRNGRTGLLGFFVGQVMGKTRGRANPELARTLIEERISAIPLDEDA